MHPTAKEIAHMLVDNGADGIIGHGPHLPQAIEVYKNKPIIYSTGNFIYGHNREEWTDNYLAEIVIYQKRIKKVVIHPISAYRQELFQPELLKGERASKFLEILKSRSSIHNTVINIHDDIGEVYM